MENEGACRHQKGKEDDLIRLEKGTLSVMTQHMGPKQMESLERNKAQGFGQ